jgi:hypothetical protein
MYVIYVVNKKNLKEYLKKFFYLTLKRYYVILLS